MSAAERQEREYALDELGYFTEDQCEKVEALMEGKTFMKFHIKWSNCAGNCTLIACTDYEETEAEIKAFFIHALIANFWAKR